MIERVIGTMTSVKNVKNYFTLGVVTLTATVALGCAIARTHLPAHLPDYRHNTIAQHNAVVESVEHPLRTHRQDLQTTFQRNISNIPLLKAAEVIVTDHGSGTVVINIWDTDHFCDETQDHLLATTEEVIKKWEIPLVGIEGLHTYGEGFSFSERIRFGRFAAVRDYSARLVGLENEVHDYLGTLLNTSYNLGSQQQKMRFHSAYCSEGVEESCIIYANNEEDFHRRADQLESVIGQIVPIDRKELAVQLASHFQDIVSVLSPVTEELKNRVKLHYRSYAGIDNLLQQMALEGTPAAISIFGSGHLLQMNGYLDFLGISHVEIFREEGEYEQTRQTLIVDPPSEFSLEELSVYQQKMAAGAFVVEPVEAEGLSELLANAVVIDLRDLE